MSLPKHPAEDYPLTSGQEIDSRQTQRSGSASVEGTGAQRRRSVEAPVLSGPSGSRCESIALPQHPAEVVAAAQDTTLAQILEDVADGNELLCGLCDRKLNLDEDVLQVALVGNAYAPICARHEEPE